jgi:hypothetical protein
MRWIKRALWGLMCFLLLPTVATQAGTYTARMRWQPSSDPSVLGYRVYSRPAGGNYDAGQDAGKPTPAPDGSVSFEITPLNVEGDYTFAVSVYTAGSESSRSNERTLGYAQVAALVDSDGDGLTDGQEDTNLNRVVDAGESDPDDPDSDNDGRGDATDVCEGTAAGAAVNGQGCSCAQVAPCSNGNACDGVETCVAGVCQPGTAPNCNDGNACTTDSCNAVEGCLHTAVPGCGQCASAADCNDNNACTTDSCNAGTCANQPRPNGTACGDANACNGAETCQAGVCAAGQALDCNDDNGCTTDSCNATSGCVNTVKSNGSSCTDGNACNGAETCQGGACTGGTPLTCNDVNPCTSDSCNPTSGCTFTNKADGASCADGNQCNGGETCQAGTCRPGSAPNCNDGDACTADTCDAAKGCTHAPLASCTGCATSADCNDDNPCTADACTNGTCTNTVRADGTSCSDGLFCTVGETCVAGMCGGGTANCQSQQTACKTASCDEARRTCVTQPLADGTVCATPDGCNAPPTCQDGACTTSAAPPCDDGNPCTADACDSAGGCSHTPVSDGTSCADRDFCDGVETCQAGACVPAAAPQCDDGNSCTIDYCDGRRRRCSHTGTSACCASDEECADDDLCTTNERCSRGRCVSDAVVCAGGGRCDLTACDPTLGCQVTPLPDGASCEDGNPCTAGETCRSGECVLPQKGAVSPAAAAAGETLVVQKFTLKNAGRRGTRLSARGSFTSFSPLDVGAGDVKLEVRDAEGTVVYSATVPGSAFVQDRGGTRLLYWIPNGETPVYNGLRKLLLTTNDGAIDVVAKGLIPPSEEETVPAPLAAHAARTSSSFDDTTLAWAMHLFNGCVSDPTLECKRWRRWLTWCR